jgi:hypothetical protein
MPRKKITSSSNNQKSFTEIRRVWGEIEVVDSDKDLRVFIRPEDVSSATPKDPGCCVFAQACKRQFAATKVLFWRSVAYVELPGPDGTPRVERFSLSPQMRNLIENFDKGNPIPNVAGFELKKPIKSETLSHKSKKQQEFQQKRKAALLKGSYVKKGKQGEGANHNAPAVLVDLRVRLGSGRVSFRKETTKS